MRTSLVSAIAAVSVVAAGMAGYGGGSSGSGSSGGGISYGPGFWAIAAVVVLAIVIGAVFLIRWYRRRRSAPGVAPAANRTDRAA
jgi:uncharacterized membrane protein